MGRIEKTVFISYRRTNFPWAYCIYQDLTHHGFDVFFDYQSIDSGIFEKVIIENIKARAHFIVILAPSALERCNESGDWLRREIETAIDESRNIIPILLESFDFGSPLVKKSLTGKLASLSSYNGMRLIAEYMEAGLEKLRNRFLNVALEGIYLHTLPKESQEITETQKAAVKDAPPIEKSQLNAQEWFERGYVFSENNNNEEAIRCLSEAIQLEPNFAKAYSIRGESRRGKGDPGGAIEDHNAAIQLEPNQMAYWGLRGVAREDTDNLAGAIEDYTKAIDLEANSASIYSLRGVARTRTGDLDGAISDFDIAIQLDPYNPVRFFNRGLAREKQKQYSKAVADYQKYLELDGGAKDGNRKQVEGKIKKLKSLSTKRKPAKKKTK